MSANKIPKTNIVVGNEIPFSGIKKTHSRTPIPAKKVNVVTADKGSKGSKECALSMLLLKASATGTHNLTYYTHVVTNVLILYEF
jgi:hypothetical protein